MLFFFFKQKTAYEMRISDWSSDVCSSDLRSITVATSMNDNEAFKRWTIGAARITRVLELPPLTADPAIFIQTTKDEIVKRSDWLCPDYADTDGNITLHFQAFIIEASGKRILVAPCIGNEIGRAHV